MSKYTIGVDFGSLSARAVLVDVKDGTELLSFEHPYAHGVMGEADISGEPTRSTTALQHPLDYLESLGITVSRLVKESGVPAEDITAIAIDFTASNILPTLADGTPLCTLERFKNEPQSYVKMWKHHGATEEARLLTEAANEIDPSLLERYGGIISSEWCFPKVYEVLRRAPEVYESAERFYEAAEWVTRMITDTPCRSACAVGYKAQWTRERGYPKKEIFERCDPRLGDLIAKKMPEKVSELGDTVGYINSYGHKLTGLPVGTRVATPIVDAHAALPAAGATEPGDLMIIVGTSACHILISDKDLPVRGACGRVMGGVIPGLYAYEAGQASVGDSLAWVVKTCVPSGYESEAKGGSLHELLSKKAERLKVGESGLIALDWLGGNRSPYADYELSGMLLGLTLSTPPEAIYRAMVEAIAYGAKRIVNEYEAGGVDIKRIIISGGIAKKSPFIMQTLSDVLGREIEVSALTQCGARGSAIYAAVAAGEYPSISDAAAKMKERQIKLYTPDPKNTDAYAQLYREYVKLGEYFYGENPIMRRLRDAQ